MSESSYGDAELWARSEAVPYQKPEAKRTDVPLVDPEAKKPKGKRTGRRLGIKAIAAGTLVAAGAAGALYANNRVNNHNDKLRDAATVEKTILSTAETTPVDLSQNVILLGAGVEFRSTPSTVNASKHNWFNITPSNVVGHVANGQEQPVAKGMIFQDKHHTTWLGFSFNDGKVASRVITSDEVAHDMVWVNASQLTNKDAWIAPRKSGELLDFAVTTLLEHEQQATLNTHGQFMSEAGNPIAWAPKAEPAGAYAAAHRADMA